MYYDRDGIPIDLWRFAELFENPEYKRVARTTITDAADPTITYDVSTVWIGIDHQFGHGVPLIYETMVFGDDSFDLDCERYPTLKSAEQGHRDAVITVAATLTDPIVMDTVESSTDADDSGSE